MGKLPTSGVTARVAEPPATAGSTSDAAPRSTTRTTLALLAALMALAAALRLYRLTALGLWEDEGWSALVAPLRCAELIRWCAQDTSPPLYYLVLHLAAAFGTSDWMLRIPSVLFGVLAIPVIYLCGRAAHSERAGLIAAALLAVNAFHLRYSQETRFYSLYFFTSLWAVYWTLRLARRPSWGRWLGWLTAVTGMLYIHSTAALYVVALTPLYIVVRRSTGRPIGRAWLAAHGAAVVLFLPWSAVQAQQVTRIVHDFWPPTPTPATLGLTVVQMLSVPFGGSEGGPVDLSRVAVLLVLPFAGLGMWTLDRRRLDASGYAGWGLLLFGLCGWALVFGFSVAVRSIYILRVLIPTLGALLLVAAITLAHLERAGSARTARVLLALMVTSGCLSQACYFRFYRKQEIRGAARYVVQHARGEEGVACVENRFRPTLEHYLKGSRLLPCPFSLARFTQPGAHASAPEREQLVADMRTLPAFWLVEIDDAHSAPVNRATEAWLGTFMRQTDARSFYAVRTLRYEPTESASSPPAFPEGRAGR